MVMSREEAGRIAARARWGEPRSVKIADLTPPQRRLVLALVDAARKEAPVVSETPTGAMSEVHGNARPAD